MCSSDLSSMLSRPPMLDPFLVPPSTGSTDVGLGSGGEMATAGGYSVSLPTEKWGWWSPRPGISSAVCGVLTWCLTMAAVQLLDTLLLAEPISCSLPKPL